ncbi:MAG TPA: hypothetical protein VK653_12315 [Xanthobacteraceae bacterium]|nr:hypothetical protein [Xanthobacteraceae bacterium]
MSEVHRVIVTIKPPKAGFAGQVAYGYYTLVDDVVTMVDPKGNTADDGTGKRYKRELAPNEDARAVACKLTKQLRLALRGGNSAPVGDFNRKIAYPKLYY